ncbi:MAG: hypothetical protein U5R46_17825 [Gammaproteobacteria bacterium]|nr:hypothetical protein [Gammaproteobacteria bacterium]
MKEFSLNLRRKQLQDFLAERPHIKVIGLQRDDVLDRFISWKMLQQTGVVKLDKAADGLQRKLTLDPGTLLAELRDIDAENRELTDMLDRLSGHRVHRIAYEDLYGVPERTQAVIREVFRFLDLPDFAPVVRMRKIIKGRPVERIGNLEACRTAVRGTEFAPLLADRG